MSVPQSRDRIIAASTREVCAVCGSHDSGIFVMGIVVIAARTAVVFCIDWQALYSSVTCAFEIEG